MDLKGRDKKYIFHKNRNEKKAGQQYSYQTKYKVSLEKETKKGHHKRIKGSIQEDDITIVNIYVSNIGVPKFIKQILTDIKGEMTIIQ